MSHTSHSIVSVSPTCSPTLPCQCNEATPTTHIVTPGPQMSTVTVGYSRQNQTPVNPMKNGEPVLALCALLALSVVLLAVVTTGWCALVYT